MHRLQQIDLEIDSVTARSSEIEAILKDDRELIRSKKELATVESALKESRTKNRQAEHALQTQRDKISSTENKLYGGSVTNPKELQDLQMEAESLKRYLITLEDLLLESMVELEEIEGQQQSAVDRFGILEAQLPSSHAELIEEKNDNQTRLVVLATEREAALAGINHEDLAEYERLRSRLGGVAIATMGEGACEACGLAQAASIQQTIRSGSELVKCSQCNRILYSG